MFNPWHVNFDCGFIYETYKALKNMLNYNS
jgi:hypothetical protein